MHRNPDLGSWGGSQFLPELADHLLGIAALLGTFIEDLDNESMIGNRRCSEFSHLQ